MATDPREELARLIREHWLSVHRGVPRDPIWAARSAADAVLSAGYRKLSDWASDPDVIEKVAKACYEREERHLVAGLQWEQRSEGVKEPYRAMVAFIAAALAATPEEEQANGD